MKNNFDKMLYENAKEQLNAYAMSIVSLINESIIELNNIENIEKSDNFRRGIEYLEIAKSVLLFQRLADLVDYNVNIEEGNQEDEEL